MENNGTNILKDKESTDIVAAGKIREQETNAPDQFKAPRAAKEREAKRALPEEDRRGHGDTGNQRVGGGGRRCEERRRSSDHRESTATAGEFGG